MIKSNSLTNGIKDIIDRFGPSALILRNIEADGQEVLFIAHEENIKSSPIKLGKEIFISKEKKSLNNTSKASREVLESVKLALKSLPDSVNSPDEIINNESHTQSEGYANPGTRLTNIHQQNVIEKDLHRLLEDTPISRHLKNLLSSYTNRPSTKSELLSQIELGIINNLPDTKEIKLDSQVHVLTGGYGVGKTSIALKIASQLRSACKDNVSIISFGKNVSTNEAKLRMLSDSLDVPCSFVKSLSELEKLLYLKQSKNIYIIDLEVDCAPEAIPFIRGIYNKVQVHLVTPADASLPSLWANCELDKWESIILTRLDSPLVPWAAIEALSKFKISLSIGSTSSEITSNLVKVTKENISRRLTGYIDDYISPLTGEPLNKESLKVRAIH